jgi:hypothetical protein
MSTLYTDTDGCTYDYEPVASICSLRRYNIAQCARQRMYEHTIQTRILLSCGSVSVLASGPHLPAQSLTPLSNYVRHRTSTRS